MHWYAGVRDVGRAVSGRRWLGDVGGVHAAAAGVYRWIATYSGDANNFPVSGACDSTNETVTVSPPPAPQILSAGPILPATGSSTGVLLFVALGSTLAGLVLVVSTSSRRRLARVPTRR